MVVDGCSKFCHFIRLQQPYNAQVNTQSSMCLSCMAVNITSDRDHSLVILVEIIYS